MAEQERRTSKRAAPTEEKDTEQAGKSTVVENGEKLKKSLDEVLDAGSRRSRVMPAATWTNSSK